MATERAYNSYQINREYKVSPAIKDKKKVNIVFNNKTKKNTVTAFVAAGLFFIMLVVFTAVASHLTYTNNQMKKSNEDLTNEIQSIKVDIKSAMNVGTIESAASNQLGMVYPSGTQFVQIENGNGAENFAAALKAEAFN